MAEVATTAANRNVIEKELQPGAGEGIWLWKPWQLFLFRVSFIFFIVLSVPFGAEWWKRTFALDWLHPNYRDIYDLARFLPDIPFLTNYSRGIKSYNDWFFILAVAIVISIIWTLLDRKRKSYNTLYYWLRVIIRYRAGIGMVGFGMQKVFPVQMAYPSTGILNSPLGDMTMQKLYWWEIGISPFYQVFTGFIEVGAGLLLFHRNTTFWGALLLVAALGSVNYVNIAYDGGVHVYSTYFVIYALFLLVYYVKDIYRLQVKEQYTVPQHYYPDLSSKGWRIVRTGLKSLNVLVFLVLLTVLQYLNFVYDPYNQPSAAGVKELRGYYYVTEFKINNQSMPYSPVDSVRWQDVAFEKWSTLTFKINLPIPDSIGARAKDAAVKKFVANNGFVFNSGAPVRDIDRTYEVFAANRRSFYYRADTVNNVLYLQDKASYMNEGNDKRRLSADPRNRIYRDDWISNDAQHNMVGEIEAIPAIGRSTRRTRAYEKDVPLDRFRDRMVLKYEAVNGGERVILSGLNERSDSLYIVLDKVNRKYLLPESVLQGGKY
ncbi:MAG: hypothetical protein QM731_01635 [Chitinophagaceae bacterium]